MAQTDGATRALAFAMVTILGTLVVCGDLIVSVLWGPRFTEAANLLPILLLAVLANTLSVACVNSITTRSQRGMVISTMSSVTGMAVGVLVWVALAPRFGTTGVAVGYLCGTTIIGGIPIAIVWSRDGHHWGRVATKVMLGIAIMLGLLTAERALDYNVWFDLGFALGFLALWLSLMRSEAASVYQVIKRR